MTGSGGRDNGTSSYLVVAGWGPSRRNFFSYAYYPQVVGNKYNIPILQSQDYPIKSTKQYQEVSPTTILIRVNIPTLRSTAVNCR